MQVRKNYGLFALATACSAVLMPAFRVAGVTVTPAYSVSYGPVGDDSNENYAATYTGSTLPVLAATQEGTVQNGVYGGANGPYVIGSMSYVVPSKGGVPGASSTVSTAFESNGSTLKFFGQNNATSLTDYVNSGAISTATANSGQSIHFHSGTPVDENSTGQIIGYNSVEVTNSSVTSTLGRNGYIYNPKTGSYVTLGLTGSGYYVTINYTNTSGGYLHRRVL